MRHGQERPYVCMAGLRCEAGHYGMCQGIGLRRAGRGIPDDRRGGRRLLKAGGPWDHLRRQPLCGGSSQQGAGHF